VPALPQRTLKVVPAPLIEGVPRAPPVLEEFILILRVQFDGRLIPIFSFCLSPNVHLALFYDAQLDIGAMKA
jgi:hypothetical protein